MCIEAGEKGWESIEFKEMYKSACEYITSERVIKHIVNKKIATKPADKLYESFKQQSEDLRLLTYKLLIENFNKKYSNLDDSQKGLLREFINNVTNTSAFPKFIEEETK